MRKGEGVMYNVRKAKDKGWQVRRGAKVRERRGQGMDKEKDSAVRGRVMSRKSKEVGG